MYQFTTTERNNEKASEYETKAAGDFFRESIYEFHNERGLHFCSEQVKLFSYIADCIASHNMYKADDNERCITKYMDYSLNCLLPDKFESISYKDNPLLFILCVADTIEPSKRFTNYHNEDSHCMFRHIDAHVMQWHLL